jgi:hypothetical protein
MLIVKIRASWNVLLCDVPLTFYSNFFLQSTAKEESSLLIVHLVALKSCDSNLLLPFPITRYIYTNRSQLGTKYDI